jgi:hypothetical protein
LESSLTTREGTPLPKQTHRFQALLQKTNYLQQNLIVERILLAMRTSITAALGAATFLITAAPADADNQPDYSDYISAVAASGDSPATDDNLVALGDIICDGLRSGLTPLDLDQTVQQSIPGITVVQTELVVHSAQDYLCPDTE